VLRGAAVVWVLALALPATAQISGNITLVSDYRFRGISLSDQKPAAQLSFGYDHPSGWYAGAFASTVQLLDRSGRDLQLIPYAGYAQRMGAGLSWDVGAGYSSFSHAGARNYAEVHGGVSSENVSTRLYYSPDYFGQGSATLYAELNAARLVMASIQLFGHIGVLRSRNPGISYERPIQYQFDVQAGTSVDFEKFNVQLAWVASDKTYTVYPFSEARNRSTVVLRLSRSF